MSQRLLEDGASRRLLEDGASIRLLEDGATGTATAELWPHNRTFGLGAAAGHRIAYRWSADR